MIYISVFLTLGSVQVMIWAGLDIFFRGGILKFLIFYFFYDLKDGMSRLITLASSLRIRLYFIGSVSRDRSNFFFFSRFSVSLLCAVLWAFYSKLLFTVKGAKNVQGRNGMMTRWQFRNWVRILWLMQYFVLLGGEKS